LYSRVCTHFTDVLIVLPLGLYKCTHIRKVDLLKWHVYNIAITS